MTNKDIKIFNFYLIANFITSWETPKKFIQICSKRTKYNNTHILTGKLTERTFANQLFYVYFYTNESYIITVNRRSSKVKYDRPHIPRKYLIFYPQLKKNKYLFGNQDPGNDLHNLAVHTINRFVLISRKSKDI